jgi:uncharacterized protein (TIGR02145 family)
MKKLFTLIIVTLITLSAFTQAPQKMSYQSVIRNASGVLVTNQSVGIRISVLQGTTSGTVVYQETYNPNPQTNANGLLSLEIGGGLAITGTFSAIDWSSGPYFLKTETDPTGGTNYAIIGTSQLLSVPYSMYAKTAGNGFSGNYMDLLNKPTLFSGSYIDLTNKPSLFNGIWANITGKPTSLAGYGITDAMSTSHVANSITSTMIGNWNTAFSWGNHAGLYRPISYVPAWSEITSKPTTLAGYGITDAVNTTDNQTIAGNKTFTGTISTSSHNITNVANPVNAQDAATKDYVDALQTQITMLKNTLKAGGIVTDIDGNPYYTVVIGTQIWMAENLKTIKYSNGDLIGTTTPMTKDINLENMPKYQWANGGNESNVATYGRLYTWYAVTYNHNVCPIGWHVPTDAEWTTLISYLGGESIAGGKLKETSITHWFPPNAGATNETGFTALPIGSRTANGFFESNASNTAWWSSSEMESNTNFASLRSVTSSDGNAYNESNNKKLGEPVRCLKD